MVEEDLTILYEAAWAKASVAERRALRLAVELADNAAPAIASVNVVEFRSSSEVATIPRGADRGEAGGRHSSSPLAILMTSFSGICVAPAATSGSSAAALSGRSTDFDTGHVVSLPTAA
jgi:hypothetical protein